MAEKNLVEMAILIFNDVPEKVLQKLLSVKLVDAILLKQALKGAFEEVMEAATE